MEDSIERSHNRRVRFKLGQLEIELEGPTAFEEFQQLKEQGLGKLMADNPQPAVAQAAPPTAALFATDQTSRVNGRPSLSDLAVRNIAQSEREWVAVYSFYLSDVYGKKTFSRGDIWQKYKESGLDNESRQSNLSENIRRAVEAGWLTRIKENTYAIQGDGQAKALEIISRTGSPKKAERKVTNKQEG